MILLFSFAVYLIHFKFVGIKDMHNIYYLGLSGEHRCPLGYLLLFTAMQNAYIELVLDRGQKPNKNYLRFSSCINYLTFWFIIGSQ